MDRHYLWNALAFLFSGGAYVFYVVPILKKEETTTLSTWVAWFWMDSAILLAMIEEHKISYQLVACTIGCVAILLVAWKIGASSEWKLLDTVCVAMVMLAALLWGITGDAGMAVVLELIAMTVGSIPLFLHFWKSLNPVSPWAWLCYFTGSLFAIPAIEAWDIVGAATPIVFLILSVLFLAAVLRTHRNNKLLKQILLRD